MMIQYLTLNFEGYFSCRIATDPDPTNEERGMSGYTMALATEDKLDQIIRLQVDDAFIKKNLRPPGQLIGMDVNLKRGVEVRSILYNGTPIKSSSLIGAKVNLEGNDGIFDGPTFESRNNITGSDDEFAFVITPFELSLTSKTNYLLAKDILDPSANAATQEIWQITNPSIYGRRLPVSYAIGDEEVKKAINVFDSYGYFRDRRRFMEDEIKRNEHIIRASGTSEEKKRECVIEIEQFKSRIHQLEFWGNRVISKINTRVNWDFEINDPEKRVEGAITIGEGGDQLEVVPKKNWAWPVKFWFGGWDGDLLTGFMRGTLSIPVDEKEAR